MVLNTQYDNLYCHTNLVQPAEKPLNGIEVGPIDQLVAQRVPKLIGWHVFLSAAQDIVNQLRKVCFLAGAASKEIHADPFG